MQVVASRQCFRALPLGLLLPMWVGGQASPQRGGRRPLLPRDSEIALARSAAPASVSHGARILVFTDTGFVVADRGTSSVTCIVSRSWPASIEPQCFDEEASTTILPIELRRVVLYHQGRSEQEVDRIIADGIRNGTFRLPRRPAVSFMMSAEQRLVGDDGVMVGSWRPHIMIYYPYLSNRDVGLSSTPDMSVGTVSDERSATSNLTIPLAKFVPVVYRAP